MMCAHMRACRNGRISMAGITSKNVNRLSEAIHHVSVQIATCICMRTRMLVMDCHEWQLHRHQSRLGRTPIQFLPHVLYDLHGFLNDCLYS